MVLKSIPPERRRVGWGFITRYTLAYMGTCLVLLAPVLVTLALKDNSLVGIGTLLVALARDILTVLIGWCLLQVSFDGESPPSSARLRSCP
jgi:hypothetical protein